MKGQWEIWSARVWHENETSKVRPVVIVLDEGEGNECQVFRVTSQAKSNRHAYEIKRWKEAGLEKRSMIILEPAFIKQEDFGRYIGTLDPLDIYGLIESIKHGSYGSMFQ